MDTDAPESQVMTPDAGITEPDAGGHAEDQAASVTPEQPATGTQEEDTFFDPAKLPDELRAGWKQLQGSYTKKMQEIAKDRQKIQAYDAFLQNPLATIQQVAQQYGMTVAQAAQVQQQAQVAQQNWEPNTWDDVIDKAVSRAKEEASRELMQQIQPYLNNVQEMRASVIEKQLSSIDPDWRLYEEDMRENMTKHPSLAADPAMLYRVSVPQDVLERRATQRALEKFNAKQDSSRMAGKSQTSKASLGRPDFSKMSSTDAFNAAVETAKQQIAKLGR